MDILWFALGIVVVAFTLFFIKRSADMDESSEN
jgi:hypothetical protein